MPRQRFSLNKDWSHDRITVRCAEENENGTFSIMEPAVFTESRPGAFASESFCLTEEGGQELLNELWRLGYRPTDATGSTGHLRAVENHATNLNQIIDKLFVELGHR